MPPTVVITEHLDEACVAWLAERTHVVRTAPGAAPDPAALAAAAGLVVRTYTRVDADFLARTPDLRVVGRAGVGLDNIDVEACARRDIAVVYTPDANTQAVVEYILGLMLDALRPRVSITADGLDHFLAMRREHVGLQLDGLTLGILGFGRIGRRLGRVADAIGMKLLVNDLLPEAEVREGVTFDFAYVDKPVLYRDSDVLSIHVDGRPANRHLIDAGALARLKSTCLLINAARGMLIDHAALRDWALGAADQGGRAVLDVHDPEPIPPSHPLLDLPNVRLLPHLASRTPTAMRNMSWVVRDVVAVLEGRAPAYPAP